MHSSCWYDQEKNSGLAGKDAYEEGVCDSIVDQFNDFFNETLPYKRVAEDDLKLCDFHCDFWRSHGDLLKAIRKSWSRKSTFRLSRSTCLCLSIFWRTTNQVWIMFFINSYKCFFRVSGWRWIDLGWYCYRLWNGWSGWSCMWICTLSIRWGVRLYENLIRILRSSKLTTSISNYKMPTPI